MYYYEVQVGVERHWKDDVFTYSFEHDLPNQAVVKVPFGRALKIGIVVSKVSKPDFATKNIAKDLEIVLPKKTMMFKNWFESYYATQGGVALAQFLPSYLASGHKSINTKGTQKSAITAPKLSKDQTEAFSTLENDQNTSVLHGITGSGKTRIYASLINSHIKKSRSCLLLYPEISLSPQMIEEIEKYSPIMVYHSRLSEKQRRSVWTEIAASKKPYVVIGARSALFLPHKDLGLVVLDEAHDTSYKQNTDVRYNSVLVAGGLSKTHKAKLIIGSATPPITESELVLKSKGSLVCLHERAIKNKSSKNTIVIDKKNKGNFKKHPLISDALIDSIKKSLGENKQSLVFINRRGTAKLTLCESCGWQAICPDCELPTTYHHDRHKQMCHTCGKIMKVETVCPNCSGKLKQKAFGSKAISSEIQQLFPKAKIGRFDSDNNKEKSFSSNFDKVKSGVFDIIVGTQQISKGLDLPLLATVGVIDADLSLHFPDYSSEERTFQLLSQVIGRVGRGHNEGEVIIQTYQPNNDIIQLATTEDWHGFKSRELSIRKKHNFPPYIYVGKVIIRDKNLTAAIKKAESTKETLSSNKTVSTDGPLPSFISKRGPYHYIQLHLKSKSRTNLLRVASGLPKEAIFELDPMSLL